jgi:acyl transferase domain-containing protein
MTERNQATPNEPLAMVGIGCRFPGGVRDADSLWQMLVNGRSAITEVPGELWHVDRYHHEDAEAVARMITRRGGFVDQIKVFDPAFWGI